MKAVRHFMGLCRCVFSLIGIAGSLMPTAAKASNFGCHGLEWHKDLPVLESEAGVFFRIQSDLKMDHRFNDKAVRQLAHLSEALAAGGTKLIYVPIPTKSLAMPKALPDRAKLYGYDAQIAMAAYQDMIARLRAAGVSTVDAAQAMGDLPTHQPPFFAADFHWNSHGARATARAVARQIQSTPGYEDLRKTQFDTKELGPDTAFSGMRRILQKHCRKTLPQVRAMRFETTLAQQENAQTAPLDLFGDDAVAAQISLVGTSFSDSEISNFTGFISQFTRLETLNYAVTGGNQFGAIQAYLTSREFQQNRPGFLVWENPIYNSLTRFGDAPMQELIAAAYNNCSQRLTAIHSASDNQIRLPLPDTLQMGDVLRLDSGTAALRALSLVFEFPDGVMRQKRIKRGDRARATGRFYVSFVGFGDDMPMGVSFAGSAADSSDIEAFICS